LLPSDHGGPTEDAPRYKKGDKSGKNGFRIQPMNRGWEASRNVERNGAHYRRVHNGYGTVPLVGLLFHCDSKVLQQKSFGLEIVLLVEQREQGLHRKAIFSFTLHAFIFCAWMLFCVY